MTLRQRWVRAYAVRIVTQGAMFGVLWRLLLPLFDGPRPEIVVDICAGLCFGIAMTFLSSSAIRTAEAELAHLEAPLNRDQIRATRRSVRQGELTDDEDEQQLALWLARRRIATMSDRETLVTLIVSVAMVVGGIILALLRSPWYLLTLIFLVPLARGIWGYVIARSRLWRLVQAGEGIEVIAT